MRVVGLTGSIGMGKSTTAAMFSARGVPVHDADAEVHRLYRGEAVAAVEAAFPGVSDANGIVRERLAARVVGDDEALRRLEAIVHPQVRAREFAFVAQARAGGHRLALLDIPLLFETGADARVSAIIVVIAPEEVQRARVLSRPAMTEEAFAGLSARQLPDAEKRRRAHFLVDSGRGLDAAQRDVDAILRALAAG